MKIFEKSFWLEVEIVRNDRKIKKKKKKKNWERHETSREHPSSLPRQRRRRTRRRRRWFLLGYQLARPIERNLSSDTVLLGTGKKRLLECRRSIWKRFRKPDPRGSMISSIPPLCIVSFAFVYHSLLKCTRTFLLEWILGKLSI